jgi:hypothetical protein
LWLGKRPERLIGDALEEIAEAEKRQSALRLGGSADEDAIRAVAGGVDCSAPDSGLADPRFAFENEGRRASRQAVEELTYSVLLPLPSDHVHGSAPCQYASPLARV